MTDFRLSFDGARAVVGDHSFTAAEELWSHLERVHRNALERDYTPPPPEQNPVDEWLAQGNTPKRFPSPGEHPVREKSTITLEDLGLI